MQKQLEDSLIQLLPFLEGLVKDLKEKQEHQRLLDQQETLSREVSRALHKRREESKRLQQEECSHIAGCSPLSEHQDSFGRTSIVWHVLDTAETVGICTNCGREFRASDPPDSQGLTYEYWRKQPCFNRTSSAGQRFRFTGIVLEPNVIEAAPEGQSRNTYTQDRLFQMLEEERDEFSGYAYPAEGLDSLPNEDIKKLFEGVREYRKALREPEKTIEAIYSSPEWSVG
jgi:hypothetical protein